MNETKRDEDDRIEEKGEKVYRMFIEIKFTW